MVLTGIFLDPNTQCSPVCVTRNLIAFSEDGSDPYVRLYLLPDKRRSGRRKTHVSKKTLNPVFDQRYGPRCGADGLRRPLRKARWCLWGG